MWIFLDYVPAKFRLIRNILSRSVCLEWAKWEKKIPNSEHREK